MQNGDKMKKIRGKLASGREIKSPVNRRQRLQNELRRILFIVIGNLIYATIVSLFLLPAKLMTSGTTGIALVVNHITGFSISAFVLIFNILMLLVGWVLLGGRFALSTVASSLIYPSAFVPRLPGYSPSCRPDLPARQHCLYPLGGLKSY